MATTRSRVTLTGAPVVASPAVAAFRGDSAERTLADSLGHAVTNRPRVAAPHLFVALECSRTAAGSSRHSLARVDRALLQRGPARAASREYEEGDGTLTLSIPDPRMSSIHAAVVRGEEGFLLEDLGSRSGTRLNGDRVQSSRELYDGDVIEVGDTLLRYRSCVSAPAGTPLDFEASGDGAAPLATLDADLRSRAEELSLAAEADAPVLLVGESGSGKDVVARAVHRLSKRRGPFVAVDCGALPAPLLEARIFGHVRGAFAGATGDGAGLVRSAEGGTLLLDDVDELPRSSQALLVRALEEREVVPAGGVRPVRFDVRVVAATHKPLERLVQRGEFRSDLFARLSAFTFRVPPLAARSEDVGLLLQSLARGRSFRLTPAAGRALLSYDWPHNVRELLQAIEIALSLAESAVIDLPHLPLQVAESLTRRPERSSNLAEDERIRHSVVSSLVRHRGNVAAAARELGKARMQVQRWMTRFGIDGRSFR